MGGVMTPRERLEAAFAREEVDRIPVAPDMVRWVRGNYGCTCEMHQLKGAEAFGFDPLVKHGMYLNSPISSDYVYRPDPAGGYRDLPDVHVDVRVENHREKTIHVRRFETPDGVLTDRIVWARPNIGYGDGPNPHREEPLVKSIADVDALRHLYPEARRGYVDDLRLFTEMIGDRGMAAYCESTNAGGWGMESLGPENMLMCAVEDKALLHAVLRVCQDRHLANLKTVLESGHRHFFVSWFQCGPSVGWSPAHIEEFFLPLIRESVELVHSHGAVYQYQDDGKMADIIPCLVDMNVDVVGALQPPPVGDCVFSELKGKYGEEVCLYGGLDPIYTFELGTPERVREAVTELLESARDGRGVVIATGEAFGPQTPSECLRELVRAVRDFSPSAGMS